MLEGVLMRRRVNGNGKRELEEDNLGRRIIWGGGMRICERSSD